MRIKLILYTPTYGNDPGGLVPRGWAVNPIDLQHRQSCISFGGAINLPNGPLFVGSKDWQGRGSLFEGEPQSDHPFIGLNRACFGLTGDDFLRFLHHMDTLDLHAEKATRMTRNHLADHRFAWAIDFSDPWGNRYELTTYDYQQMPEKVGVQVAKQA